jgi:uncharacterized protein YjbI with pentapeptide repeats
MNRALAAAAIVIAAASLRPANASDQMTADQVKVALSAAPNGKLDLSGKDMHGDDLTGLDLSGANLSHANLAGANLHGVKLVGSDLTGADLRKADLTFTWIMKARFDHANLQGATLQTVITSEGMDNKPETAASFVGADLSDTSATVHFSGDDMRGAIFKRSSQSVVLANQSMGMLRSEYVGANLDGADFEGAQLGRITFRFAKLNNANFRGADLTRADFTGAYLTGADFTGAKFDHTDFEAAIIKDAKGLPAASATQ